MKNRIFTLTVLTFVLFAFSAPLFAADWFLQASHAEPDQTTGPRLLVSQDGLNWLTVNGDKSVMKPAVGEVCRDASIARSKDGTYHMVWTVSWNARKYKGFGYARSKDLVHWSDQKIVPVMENEPETDYIWAPEIFWNDKEEKWLIHWASTVNGKFPESLSYFDGHHNGRIFYTQTTDFENFEPSKLLFDPHCLAIDSYLYKESDSCYRVFFKADRKEQPRRGILMACAPMPTGPYTVDQQMINLPNEGWIEGPSVIRVGDTHRVYYALHPASGLYETTDFKTWTNRNKDMKILPGYRHGTVIRIPESDAKRLIEFSN